MNANCFATMNGLPIYGERVNIDNVNINDVITYKINGRYVFSYVIGRTPTMIKVCDLVCENVADGVNLYTLNQKNHITKCLLKPTRKIHKVVNINIL